MTLRFPVAWESRIHAMKHLFRWRRLLPRISRSFCVPPLMRKRSANTLRNSIAGTRSQFTGLPDSHGASGGRSGPGQYLVVGKFARGVCYGWCNPGGDRDLRRCVVHGRSTYRRTRNSIALGAQTRDVLWLVLGKGAVLVLTGALLGGVGAYGVSRLLIAVHSVIADTRSADSRGDGSCSCCSGAAGVLHPGASRNESRSAGGVAIGVIRQRQAFARHTRLE